QSTIIFGAKPLGDGRELSLRGLDRRRVMQLHPRVIPPHVIYDQRPRVPEWLSPKADVRALIHIARNAARRDAAPPHCRHRSRALSPTSLNVARMPRCDSISAKRFVASSSAGSK